LFRNAGNAVVDLRAHVLAEPVLVGREVQAILGLFDGEIRISEKEAAKGREKVLQIRRLHSQKYLEDELILTKQKLEQ
jgi:hypothetical protein